MAFEFMEVLPVMTMQLAQAGLNLFVAACLGAAIGLERQWPARQSGCECPEFPDYESHGRTRSGQFTSLGGRECRDEGPQRAESGPL